MTIGEKLSDLRRRAGLTQDTVAEYLNISAQAVSKWENDLSCPDITFLPKIAYLYKTTVDEILNGESLKEVAVIDEAVRKDVSEMILHIIVDSNDDKVRINLPLAIVSILTETESLKNINIGKINLSSIDFKSILPLIHNGVIGKLLEIDSSDGSKVIIEVS